MGSKYRFKGHDFINTAFDEFVNNYNIFNNDLASEENLNASVNRLKREFNTIFGLIRILTSMEAMRWRPDVIYYPGEIVTFYSDPELQDFKKEPKIEDTEASYYMAIEYFEPIYDNNGKEIGKSKEPVKNLAFKPNLYKELWLPITLNSLYPKLYWKNYVLYSGNRPWTPVDDWDPINLNFLKSFGDALEKKIKDFNASEYMKIRNNTPFDPANEYDAVTKKYADSLYNDLIKLINNIKDSYLKDFLYLDSGKKMRTSNLTADYIRTTDSGILPGSNMSTLGNPGNKFKAMYANEFFGIASSARYADVAEYYETAFRAPKGTLIGLNNEFHLFKNGSGGYIGVVSDKPGFILNSECNGILIALKGQTPVRVIGPVKKGEYLMSSEIPGVARSCGFFKPQLAELVGVALESSDLETEKLINTKI